MISILICQKGRMQGIVFFRSIDFTYTMFSEELLNRFEVTAYRINSALPIAMILPLFWWASVSANERPMTFYPNIESVNDIRSFDVVAVQDKLHAAILTMGNRHESNSIVYSVSADGGNTWMKPIRIDRSDDAPVLSRRGNDIKLAVSGRRRVVVWQSAGLFAGSGPMVIATSDDGGQHWQRGINPANEDGLNNQSYMEIAADRRGHFHLIWLDDREEKGNTQGLRYAQSSDGGRSWQRETTLDPEVCTCCWNRLLVLPDQRISLLYRDDDPHDMRMALGEPGAVGWRDRGPVGAFNWQFQGCPHCGGGIAVAQVPRQVRLHSVVWTGKGEKAGLYYLSSDDIGKSWGAPVRMGVGQSREGDIAARSFKNLALVYSETDGQGATLRYRDSRDGGNAWSVPRDLSAPGKAPDHPRILAFREGFKVFWTEQQEHGRKRLAIQSLQ